MVKLLVNVDVDDLDRGERFYVDAFGLSVGRRFGVAAVELLGAEAPIYLLLKPGGTSPFAVASTRRDYARHWTPVHLDVAVDDLDEAMQRADRAGAKREGPVGEHAWGRLALYSDPFGNGFCLLEFKGRGYDELATS